MSYTSGANSCFPSLNTKFISFRNLFVRASDTGFVSMSASISDVCLEEFDLSCGNVTLDPVENCIEVLGFAKPSSRSHRDSSCCVHSDSDFQQNSEVLQECIET